MIVCEIDCLACQDEFFVNSVKTNGVHALGFALHMFTIFGLPSTEHAIQTLACSSCFLPQMLV
jgi:hypothetical protein